MGFLGAGGGGKKNSTTSGSEFPWEANSSLIGVYLAIYKKTMVRKSDT
jgi:hypothetical protein